MLRAACTAKSGEVQRSTLDFCSEQFDIRNLGSWGSVGLDLPTKYHDSCSNATHECSFDKPPTVRHPRPLPFH